MMLLYQVLVVVLFVAVHLFGGELRFLGGIPRSRWLSIAGGISVAYVFVHVLPELLEAQEELAEHWAALPWVEHHAFLVALAGLVVFYGLEKLVRWAQRRRSGEAPSSADEPAAGLGVFWLHIASFALYNGLIGYLLVHREEQDLRELAFFAGAMGVHFLVNDHGLQQAHQEVYRKRGRWVLVGAIVAGWALGLAIRTGPAPTHALFAFLAGGIVLNVLKEELPEERESRFGSFAAGAGGYAGLLLLL